MDGISEIKTKRQSADKILVFVISYGVSLSAGPCATIF